MMKMNLSEISYHQAHNMPGSGYSRHHSGWDIDKLDGPFDYIYVHTSSKEEINEVSSIDYIAERFLEGGGNIVRPKLTIPGVGSLITCEDTSGHRFSFIEEEKS